MDHYKSGSGLRRLDQGPRSVTLEKETKSSLLQRHLGQFNDLLKVQPQRHTEQQLKIEREKKNRQREEEEQSELERIRQRYQVTQKNCKGSAWSDVDFEDKRQEMIKRQRALERLRNEEEASIIQYTRKEERQTNRASKPKWYEVEHEKKMKGVQARSEQLYRRSDQRQTSNVWTRRKEYLEQRAVELHDLIPRNANHEEIMLQKAIELSKQTAQEVPSPHWSVSNNESNSIWEIDSESSDEVELPYLPNPDHQGYAMAVKNRWADALLPTGNHPASRESIPTAPRQSDARAAKENVLTGHTSESTNVISMTTLNGPFYKRNIVKLDKSEEKISFSDEDGGQDGDWTVVGKEQRENQSVNMKHSKSGVTKEKKKNKSANVEDTSLDGNEGKQTMASKGDTIETSKNGLVQGPEGKEKRGKLAEESKTVRKERKRKPSGDMKNGKNEISKRSARERELVESSVTESSSDSDSFQFPKVSFCKSKQVQTDSQRNQKDSDQSKPCSNKKNALVKEKGAVLDPENSSGTLSRTKKVHFADNDEQSIKADKKHVTDKFGQLSRLPGKCTAAETLKTMKVEGQTNAVNDTPQNDNSGTKSYSYKETPKLLNDSVSAENRIKNTKLVDQKGAKQSSQETAKHDTHIAESRIKNSQIADQKGDKDAVEHDTLIAGTRIKNSKLVDQKGDKDAAKQLHDTLITETRIKNSQLVDQKGAKQSSQETAKHDTHIAESRIKNSQIADQKGDKDAVEHDTLIAGTRIKNSQLVDQKGDKDAVEHDTLIAGTRIKNSQLVDQKGDKDAAKDDTRIAESRIKNSQLVDQRVTNQEDNAHQQPSLTDRIPHGLPAHLQQAYFQYLNESKTTSVAESTSSSNTTVSGCLNPGIPAFNPLMNLPESGRFMKGFNDGVSDKYCPEYSMTLMMMQAQEMMKQCQLIPTETNIHGVDPTDAGCQGVDGNHGVSDSYQNHQPTYESQNNKNEVNTNKDKTEIDEVQIHEGTDESNKSEVKIADECMASTIRLKGKLGMASPCKLRIPKLPSVASRLTNKYLKSVNIDPSLYAGRRNRVKTVGGKKTEMRNDADNLCSVDQRIKHENIPTDQTRIQTDRNELYYQGVPQFYSEQSNQCLTLNKEMTDAECGWIETGNTNVAINSKVGRSDNAAAIAYNASGTRPTPRKGENVPESNIKRSTGDSQRNSYFQVSSTQNQIFQNLVIKEYGEMAGSCDTLPVAAETGDVNSLKTLRECDQSALEENLSIRNIIMAMRLKKQGGNKPVESGDAAHMRVF